MDYTVVLKGDFDREIAPSNTAVLSFDMTMIIEKCDTPFEAMQEGQAQLEKVFSDGLGNNRPILQHFHVYPTE